MTETRAPFNGKKKEPAGVFVRLPLSEDAASIIRDDIASQILTTDALTHTILAIGTPVTGGEMDYEATVAHYEGKLAERDADIARLQGALSGLLQEWEKLTRYGSPLAKQANPRVATAKEVLKGGGA